MRRILIIKMWAIGDILTATPMLNAIRAREPDARISWVVESAHADILTDHPLIDEVIPLDSGQWRRHLRNGNIPAWVRRTAELHGQMRARKFDAVLNCQTDKWWTYFLCASPVRVGLFYDPLPSIAKLYTAPVVKPISAGIHNTDNYLQATTAIDFPPASRRMTVGETPDEQPFWDAFSRDHGLAAGCPVVALSPFTNDDNRSIDPEFTARIADWLAEEYQAGIIMTCGPKDGPRARAIVEMSTRARIAVADRTTLREFISIVRHADIVISGDSSPMHLAAALDRPYVALFGPTPSSQRAPLAGRGRILAKPLPCAPCDRSSCSNSVFQECMKLIELADVQSSVRDLLASSGRTAAQAPAC
ncbi:MAG: glycosyltransferase family 9 protein [Capsulimonadaceae bacterium]